MPSKRAVLALMCVSAILGVITFQVISTAWASRNASGTYSLPSGNPVTTGTTITSSWANNTLSDLSSEMTDSLNRSGKGAMLAPLRLTSGTVSAPSLTFDSDRTCGLYRAGAGDSRMVADGGMVQQWIPGATTIAGTVTSREITAVAVGSNTAGITATGRTSGAGGVFAAGTAATGASWRTAVDVTNGVIDLDGVTEADSDLSVKNKLGPSNLPKAWGTITGGASPTVGDGFNITSLSCGTNVITVNVGQDFASSDYVVIANARAGNGYVATASPVSGGSFTIGVYDSDATAAVVDLCSGSPLVDFIAFGQQ